MPDPVVDSINALNIQQRAVFMQNMAIVGDALQEVTGAFRINYAILGNTDQVLHAHIVPRYLDEPESLRKGLPWSYPQDVMEKTLFDHGRDKELMAQLKTAMEKRLEI